MTNDKNDQISAKDTSFDFSLEIPKLVNGGTIHFQRLFPQHGSGNLEANGSRVYTQEDELSSSALGISPS